MKEGGGIYESPKNIRNSLQIEGKNDEVQIIGIEDDDQIVMEERHYD